MTDTRNFPEATENSWALFCFLGFLFTSWLLHCNLLANNWLVDVFFFSSFFLLTNIFLSTAKHHWYLEGSSNQHFTLSMFSFLFFCFILPRWWWRWQSYNSTSVEKRQETPFILLPSTSSPWDFLLCAGFLPFLCFILSHPVTSSFTVDLEIFSTNILPCILLSLSSVSACSVLPPASYLAWRTVISPDQSQTSSGFHSVSDVLLHHMTFISLQILGSYCFLVTFQFLQSIWSFFLPTVLFQDPNSASETSQLLSVGSSVLTVFLLCFNVTSFWFIIVPH